MEREKKECILSAACRAFGRFGFKKASVEEIAREAGVAKGTVYLAADTKEDLFYQAVHREVRAYTAEIAKLIDPRVPADELLVQTTFAGLKYLDARPLVRDLIFGNHQLILPEWAERLDELRALGRTTAAEILRLGVRQGVFRAEIDVDQVSEILEDVAIATHVFHNRGKNREEKLLRRMRTAFDLLLNGLRSVEHAHKSLDHHVQKAAEAHAPKRVDLS
jgi:AcrR family transcriptional regulator